MPSSTALMSPDQKATQIRIHRATAQPGAKGKRGFLLWVAAAFPKKVSDAIAVAASKHIAPGGFAGLGYQQRTQWKSSATFNGLGDDTSLYSIGVDSIDLTPSTAQAVADATDSGAASTSWVSDIANAFSNVLPALTQAQLAKQQASAAQQIFNVNLQRAQQGLAPIPTSPSNYGVLSPTVNFGLSGGTQSAFLWGIGGIAAVWLISSALKSGSRSRKH